MPLLLATPWQLSPLTDLTLPQDDLTLPAPLRDALPDEMLEADVVSQEWHLMHDFEIDAITYRRIAGYDLILAGIEHYAEVRVNGVAVFDCDQTQTHYRKDITARLHAGKNRLEILFIQEDEALLEEEAKPSELPNRHALMGIWQVPRIELIEHVRLSRVTTEQVWHHADACELIVSVDYEVLKPSLVAATMKCAGISYQVPLDMRANTASGVFYIEAPYRYAPGDPNSEYQVVVEIEGQKKITPVRFAAR